MPILDKSKILLKISGTIEQTVVDNKTYLVPKLDNTNLSYVYINNNGINYVTVPIKKGEQIWKPFGAASSFLLILGAILLALLFTNFFGIFFGAAALFGGLCIGVSGFLYQRGANKVANAVENIDKVQETYITSEQAKILISYIKNYPSFKITIDKQKIIDLCKVETYNKIFFLLPIIEVLDIKNDIAHLQAYQQAVQLKDQTDKQQKMQPQSNIITSGIANPQPNTTQVLSTTNNKNEQQKQSNTVPQYASELNAQK